MQSGNSSQPWASFCMSTYQRPQFLRKQIESLLRQTFPDFQIIISDNDPQASGRVVAESFHDPRIIYQSNGENLGMVRSFNRSLQRAQSEFVVMITDDDVVYPEMLATLRDLVERYPGFGMYYGGYDRFYSSAATAAISKARVGVNSLLANFDLGYVREFSPDDFPRAYLEEDFGGGIFWSVGIVRRSIALEIGGMPDYGSPNMADCGYILLSGSRQGAVFINTSLGSQSIHSDNYSFKDTNFEKFRLGATGFYEWTRERLPAPLYTDQLDRKLKDFVARMLVSFFVFVKKNIRQTGFSNASFERCVRECFSIPFMRKWKIKYWIAVYLPFLFPLLVSLKKSIFGK